MALAYLGKDLKTEASQVLAECKDRDVTCRSLFYRISKDVEVASTELKGAIDSGFLPAAYYLARMYDENGDKEEDGRGAGKTTALGRVPQPTWPWGLGEDRAGAADIDCSQCCG